MEVPLFCVYQVILWTLHLGCSSCPPLDITLFSLSLPTSLIWAQLWPDSSSPLRSALGPPPWAPGASPPVGCISQVAGACVYVGEDAGWEQGEGSSGYSPPPRGPARALFWATAQCLCSHSACSITSPEARALWVLQAWGWKLLSARI